MPDPTPNEDADTIRREAADDERAAILAILERHARLLSHGHGATGAQALQRLAEEIERRGRA
jgi:hypothetical protein